MAGEDVARELARIAADVGPALAPAGQDGLLRSIVATARRLFGAEASSLALLDDEGEHLVFRVADGRGTDTVVGISIPASQGIAGYVVQSGQPMAIEDVQRDPRFTRDVAETTGYLPTSILAMPLETERGILGVLEILDRQTEGLARAQEMEIVALFAQQAALAIENSRIFRDMGRVLFESAARAADGDVDLAQALRDLANEAPGPDAELAEVAALVADLGRLGEEERRTAVEILSRFLTYARRARRHR
jgi:GAF domain-containing protein